MKKYFLYAVLVVGLFQQPAKAQLSWQQAAEGLSISSLDPDYVKWYNAVTTAGGTLTATQQKATNTLVVNAKAHGWWANDTAIWVAIGADASVAKFNIKRPQDADASYRLTFNAGWTFSTSGATPNGTSSYADTHLTPSVTLSQNSNSISFYSKTNAGGTHVEMGSNNGSVSTILETTTSNITYLNLSAASYITFTDTDSRGYYLGSRTASNALALYKNGVSQVTGTTASSGLSNYPLYISCYNQSSSRLYFSPLKWIFSSIGGGQNSTDANNKASDVNAWATTLGINEY